MWIYNQIKLGKIDDFIPSYLVLRSPEDSTIEIGQRYTPTRRVCSVEVVRDTDREPGVVSKPPKCKPWNDTDR